ncbi:Coatomer gamma subunit [Trema orientale]|uniref:Coatomer subunit gamma n=1 Tax=Trema orientale TaxID=63057 RepID=A0A2P5EH58_TREOI|nr:Coatomer gamma subunit [Trema orientale]
MAQPLVKKDDDRDDEADYHPFLGIEKGAVLQEARVFNDPQLDARRCSQVITKLLYLLNQGESFTKIEATEVFFAVTKLFQSRDIGLRRMVYLMIKELSPSADEVQIGTDISYIASNIKVIIVTSSLMKDMNSKTDMYRANAIRVLCRITDGTLLTQIERYLKQAIVDKNPVVASAALVSGIHLLQTNPEIVKRWSNEVQEAVQSRAALVQFHALALLHQIRQNDRLAVSKLVTSLTRGTVRSPLAQCLLIRYTSQVIRESGGNTQTGDRPFYDYLESCLRHKAEMVIFEAAKAITELSGVTNRELTPAITVLQLFLSSSKPVLRFAAVRTLNKVAMTHPMAVTNCNIDMESLISDPNRSIATLAITTLLKTGNESSVDRLMKQITNFMSDIADEFKIVVVEAIRSLCLKFPLKYRSLMNFLSNILREEGGFEYKKAIVDSIVILISDIPDAKESGLLHLCEFIEDCEFTYLSTQILHFLGIEGPKTSDPSKYIRYIYNRVHLENATVRASAVSTLAKFGALVDSLKPRIFILLRRCLFDSDDEVRDRATLYLNTLGGDGSVVETDNDVKDFLFGSLDVPLVNLETSLKNYEPSEEPFDINSVPKEIKSQPLAEKKAPGKKQPGLGASPSGPASTVDAYDKLLSSIPEFSNFGRLFKSSPPVELTEAETEYAVNVVKHIFDSHVVFQYNCTNTIPEQLLENVTVVVDASEAEDFSEVASKPLRSLPYDTPGQTFVAFEKPEGVPAVGKFSNMLRFIVKEVDPSTGEAEEDGVEDEYQLEDLEVVAADYMLKVPVSNFRNAWESMDPESEQVDEYGLGPRESLTEAVSAVINLLGMQPCEMDYYSGHDYGKGSEVVPNNSRSHTCLLSGVYIGNVKLLVRLSFGMDSSREVAMKLAVRSDDVNVSSAIHDIVASG